MEEQNLEENSKRSEYKKQICGVLLGLCCVLLVFSTFEFVYPVKALLLGSFGLLFYPMLFFTMFFCLGVLSGRKFVYSIKYVVFLFLCFFFFVCILHIIFTNFENAELNYLQYLTTCFNSMYTPGGAFVGIFTYPITSLLHSVAGIVIYCIAFVISLYFVMSYLESVKRKKIVKEVKKTPRYEDFDAISQVLQDEKNEEEEPIGEVEKEEQEKVDEIEDSDEEDEDDIIIKDEIKEKDEVLEAKARLGLSKDSKPMSANQKLFSENWQNRSIIDKPSKFIVESKKVEKQKNSMYERGREYLSTLYEPNTNINANPIINAENYDDYVKKMKMIENQNRTPIKRDFELNVNQTLVSSESNRILREDVFNKVNMVEKNNNGIQGKEQQFGQPKFSNINFQSRQDVSSFNGIEGLEEDFIKPEPKFKFSPLNPVNFDLNQQKYIEEEEKPISSQKFLERDNSGEISMLDENSISSSLGSTYNLPKSLRQQTNMFTDLGAKTDISEDKKNAPNLVFSGNYVKPPINLLETYVNEEDKSTNHEHNIEVLEKILEEFKIPAKVEAVRRGAAVTRYELRMPAGIPVRKIHMHGDDIAMALAAKGEVRIETPIKGKSAVGIEVPNAQIDKVGLKDIISSQEFNNSKSPLNFALGKDVDGRVFCCNLAKMPHLLVAGSTGSGKSVCLNSLILSLIYRTSPEDLRLILVDPKRVEFGIYNNLPHLLMPKVITEPQKAINAFDWLINEMERRFTVFQDCFVKNITEYNSQPDVVSKKWQKLPYIVLIVDELADLVVTTNKKELEERIIRLTQKARAAGIHVVLATQRPSVDIITGSIKINLPARIAFAVSQFVDSKTILDQGGAEKLLGRGDMLYSPSDAEPMRIQGAFVDTPEVKRIVDFIKEHNTASYDENVTNTINSDGTVSNAGGVGNVATVGASSGEEFDSLMPDALKLVIENGQASISMLQRRFSIGFSRAARIIDQMELARFIASADGSKPRTVFITMDEYNQLYGNCGNH